MFNKNPTNSTIACSTFALIFTGTIIKIIVIATIKTNPIALRFEISIFPTVITITNIITNKEIAAAVEIADIFKKLLDFLFARITKVHHPKNPIPIIPNKVDKGVGGGGEGYGGEFEEEGRGT